MGVRDQVAPTPLRERDGSYRVAVRHQGRRRWKKIGKEKREALEVVHEVNAQLALGDFEMSNEAERLVRFGDFARAWFQREILLPHERGDEVRLPEPSGTSMEYQNFRSRVFNRIVRRAFGPGRRVTPHFLRHTFASLHLARGTNLKGSKRPIRFAKPASRA